VKTKKTLHMAMFAFRWMIFCA